MAALPAMSGGWLRRLGGPGADEWHELRRSASVPPRVKVRRVRRTGRSVASTARLRGPRPWSWSRRRSCSSAWRPSGPDLELPSYTFGTRFFLAQAQSLTDGNLAVRPEDLPGECFVHDGKCYGYFGLTPSLLRAPFLPVLDELGSLTPVFMCAALTLALWAAVDMMRRAWLRVGVRARQSSSRSRSWRRAWASAACWCS
jgi:hypothetical protein